MKIILISLLLLMAIIQFANLKKYRVHPEEGLFPYDIAENVVDVREYFNLDNLVMEQLEDDFVKLGGYGVSIKSWDRNLPAQCTIRTQFYDKSKWNEGPLRIIVADLCPEMDKWRIEDQHLTGIIDLPPGTPTVPWRAYIRISQGPPGFEVFKIGFSVRLELEAV